VANFAVFTVGRRFGQLSHFGPGCPWCGGFSNREAAWIIPVSPPYEWPYKWLAGVFHNPPNSSVEL